MGLAAEELEGHVVGVPVDVAADLLEGGHATVRVAADVDLGLGVLRAAVGDGGEEGGGAADLEGLVGVGERELPAAHLGGPHGLLRRLGGGAAGHQQLRVGVLDEVGAQRGGLEVERRAAGHQGVAAVGEGVAVLRVVLAARVGLDLAQLRVAHRAFPVDVRRGRAPLGGAALCQVPAQALVGAVPADRHGVAADVGERDALAARCSVVVLQALRPAGTVVVGELDDGGDPADDGGCGAGGQEQAQGAAERDGHGGTSRTNVPRI